MAADPPGPQIASTSQLRRNVPSGRLVIDQYAEVADPILDHEPPRQIADRKGTKAPDLDLEAELPFGVLEHLPLEMNASTPFLYGAYPPLPRTSASGEAQGDPRGQRGRGSILGASQARARSK